MKMSKNLIIGFFLTTIGLISVLVQIYCATLLSIQIEGNWDTFQFGHKLWYVMKVDMNTLNFFYFSVFIGLLGLIIVLVNLFKSIPPKKDKA